MNKIHFERSRNRELNEELAQLKQNFIEKYLCEYMEEFKQSSEENQHLRKIYKKEAGGGYRQKVKLNSVKPQEWQKINQPIALVYTETFNARNSTK